MIPEHIQPILDADAHAYIKRLAGWPYAGVATTAERWARRKYLCAKEFWHLRDKPCPGFFKRNGAQMTWAERFEEMWSESLVDYRARLHSAQERAA